MVKAQFDLRTRRMIEEWYLAFSEVRQGSFLPRVSGANKKWNEYRKTLKRSRGRTMDVTWESLSAPTVKFLHWIGFNPRSGLQLPNEDTTQALAFLAHDFMGKITEKKISLK